MSRQLYSVRLLPPLPAPRVSPQSPFTIRDDDAAAVLCVALVHRHLAPGLSCRPSDGKGRGLRHAVGWGSEAEGEDYGARTCSEWTRRLVYEGAVVRHPLMGRGRVQGIDSAPRAHKG